MGFAARTLLHAALLAGGMVLCLEAGRRIGLARIRRHGKAEDRGLGTVEAALFGLLGLVFALTFSGASSRLDTRRQLVAEEANAIGTAWLRVDLLPAGAQAAIRDRFRAYLDVRIETFRGMEDEEETRRRLRRAAELHGEIWKLSVAACREAGASPQAPILVLPALNAMIDITATREEATLIHPPGGIYLLLGALSLVASLLAGHGMAPSTGRSWLHVLSFAFMVAATFYVILDLEYPRKGLIRIRAADQVLLKLRDTLR